MAKVSAVAAPVAPVAANLACVMSKLVMVGPYFDAVSMKFRA